MKPQARPPTIPATSETGIATKGEAAFRAIAAMVAVSAPTRNWPCAPMLNRPPLNPMPTARPAKQQRSGVHESAHDPRPGAERALESAP